MGDFLSFLSSWTGFDINAFVDAAGSNPFWAMGVFFVSWGWIIFVGLMLWMITQAWLVRVQTKYGAKKEWILLKITVPKATEQTPRAVENLFASLAGAHSPISFVEKWFLGHTQSPMAVEIASIDGNVSYYMHAERRLRDLMEASVYAQYPDAEIHEVPDYALNVPSHYPDEEWDMWCTEMIPVKPDSYPLKTYPEFEDAVSGEFKDPLSSMLENFSRLGPGEQAWYQIVITPTYQREEGARAEKLIAKLKGVPEKPHKKNILDHATDLPFIAARTTVDFLMGSELGGGEHKKEDKKELIPRMMALSPGERYILEAIERKASKIGFLSKVRFVYVGKKNVMMKARAVQPFIGAIKQMNTFNMQALKPDSKHVGVNGSLLITKDHRNDHRKNHMIKAYRARSNWKGMSWFHLSSEELATLWHFPIFLQVKAPGTVKTEANKSEPPSNIPFA